MGLPSFVAVDLDGTVLREDHGISPRTISALERLRSRGVPTLIATGRPRRSTLPWAAQLGVDAGLVCHNGALVYAADSSILSETTIPEATARRLIELSRTMAFHFHGFAADEWLYERVLPGTSRYEHRSKFKGLQVDFDQRPQLGFHKAIFIADAAEAVGIADRVRESLGDSVEIYPSGTGFVELVAPGVGKGTSLSLLVEHLGGKMSEVLAFGDAWNDEDLLLRAGIGVAMGNAPDELKERIGRVALGIDEDGVAVWVEGLLDANP